MTTAFQAKTEEQIKNLQEEGRDFSKKLDTLLNLVGRLDKGMDIANERLIVIKINNEEMQKKLEEHDVVIIKAESAMKLTWKIIGFMGIPTILNIILFLAGVKK